MYIKNFILAFSLLLLGLNLGAQVSIIPQFKGGNLYHIDQLFQLVVVNNSPTLVNGNLVVEVRENSGELVLETASFPLSLSPGIAIRGGSLRWPTALQMGQSPAAAAFQRTGQFPFGEFVLCYYFRDGVNPQNLGEYCSEFQVQINGKPELVYPRNQSTIIASIPVLQWRPPVSLSRAELHYDLRLVKLESGQSLVDAIRTNGPLLNRTNLRTQQLVYPLDAPQLEENITYVWQVTAWFGQHEVGQTAIWTFQIGDELAIPKANTATNYSYPVPASIIKGAYYIADGMICFALQNRSQETNLQYTIYPLRSPDIPLRDLPLMSLRNGWNKLEIDGASIPGMKSEEMYVLEIEEENGGRKFLQFKYVDNE